LFQEPFGGEENLMSYPAGRIRAITWIVCALAATMTGSSARGGLATQFPLDKSAALFISPQSAAQAAPLEALEIALPAPPHAVIGNKPGTITSYAPAAFADGSASPGAVIPLPSTMWTGLVILSALAAVSALRTFRR